MPEFSRRKFLKLTLAGTFATAGMGVGGYAYARDVEPRWVEVNPLTLQLPRLTPDFNGYRLVQISDIHMGTGMTSDHLAYIVDLVNAQTPDAVAITGDFVTHGDLGPLMPALIAPLRRLQAADGIFAVLGNHDHWTDPNAIRAMLVQSGVRDLSNGVHTLSRGGESLHLAGVDDYWERQDKLDDVLAALPADGAALLLAHEPDYADISAATGRFDLQISGHSHGGQFVIPFVGPPVVPTYAEKYPLGRYQVGDMIQYTNRGVGTINPALRFNCRPEITVFTLETV